MVLNNVRNEPTPSFQDPSKVTDFTPVVVPRIRPYLDTGDYDLFVPKYFFIPYCGGFE